MSAMTKRIFSSSLFAMTELNEKFILQKFEQKASQIEWKIYNNQQIELIIRRLQATTQTLAVSAFRRNEKFFHIKIVEQIFEKFAENFYVEWVVFVRIMKNQFDQNDCDNFASNSNRFKIFHVEIFLKKNINAQLLWQAERTTHSDRKFIWNEFKNFLKNNIKRIFTRKKNIYDKYLKYKQNFKQSIMNYDAHRIALRAEVTSDLKSNAKINLQNFIKNLRENHKNYVIDHDLENKTTILNRFKFREDRDVKKRFNKIINEFILIFENLTFTFDTHTFSFSTLDNSEIASNSVSNSALESMQILYSSWYVSNSNDSTFIESWFNYRRWESFNMMKRSFSSSLSIHSVILVLQISRHCFRDFRSRRRSSHSRCSRCR